MKARVRMTPARMERLLSGKTLQFKLPSPADEIEILLDNTEDAFEKFDRIFRKILDKVEKAASTILK